MNENTTLTRIHELCSQRGWSLYKLAKESGIPYSSLNNIFIRNTQPTIPTLEKICHGFQISMSDFFTDTISTSSPILSEDETELVDCYRLMSQSNKKLLQKFTCFLVKESQKL